MANIIGTSKTANKTRRTPAAAKLAEKTSAEIATIVDTPATENPNTFTTEDRAGMSITYETVTATAETKKIAADNPHISGVDAAIAAKGDPLKAFAFTVANGDVKAHLRWLRNAGSVKNVTVRVKTSDAGDGKTRIEFRAVDKITRQRKPKENGTAATETPAVTEGTTVPAE